MLAAALVNFNYIANGVVNTTEAINAMGTDPVEVAAVVDSSRMPTSVPEIPVHHDAASAHNSASNYETQLYLVALFGAFI